MFGWKCHTKNYTITLFTHCDHHRDEFPTVFAQWHDGNSFKLFYSPLFVWKFNFVKLKETDTSSSLFTIFCTLHWMAMTVANIVKRPTEFIRKNALPSRTPIQCIDLSIFTSLSIELILEKLRYSLGKVTARCFTKCSLFATIFRIVDVVTVSHRQWSNETNSEVKRNHNSTHSTMQSKMEIVCDFQWPASS